MPKWGYTLLAVLCGALAGSAVLFAQTPAGPVGYPSGNMALTATLAEKTYPVETPVEMRIRMQNTGTSALAIANGTTTYCLALYAEDGTAVPKTTLARHASDPEDIFGRHAKTLAPGKGQDGYVDLNKWFAIPGPGTYRAQVIFQGDAGLALSNLVPVTIAGKARTTTPKPAAPQDDAWLGKYQDKP